MQLKRDTDYAFRILFCLKETLLSDGEERQKSLPVSQIASRIGVMRVTTGRVCEQLVQAGLILVFAADDAGEKSYAAAAAMLTSSVLDVVEAIEGTGKLFAVFDRRSLLYKSCGKRLDRLQKKQERFLFSTPLTAVIGTIRRPM